MLSQIASSTKASQQPTCFKRVLITWLAIYPAITLLLFWGGALLEPLPLPLRTLVLTGILVPLMVCVLVPILNRVLAPWLQ